MVDVALASRPMMQVAAEPVETGTGAVNSTDADLMARVAAGDREALAELIDRHKSPLLNYLTRVCGQRDQAEEIAQETFLRLFLAAERGGYREQGKFPAFLYRIATNLARSDGRHQRRFLSLTGPGPAAGGEPGEGAPADGRWLHSDRHADPAANAEAGLLSREFRRVLEHAVGRLPMRFRVPVVLFAIEGWSHQSIAQLMGCREGTVKSRIHRGRERLRRVLEQHGMGVPS